MGDTGEKPYLPTTGVFAAGERPRSDSPLGACFGRALKRGLNAYVALVDAARSWPCSRPLYSAYGERTAPCNCPFPFISDL
jgi:hypothetical protein